MGSPAPPEAVASLDPKPQDAPATKEPASDANGHTTPVDAKSQDTAPPETTSETAAPETAASEAPATAESEKPLVNGGDERESHDKPNGVAAEDVEMKTDDTSTGPEPDESTPGVSKANEKAEDNLEGETKGQSEDKPEDQVEAEPEVKPEEKSEVKPEKKSENEPEEKTEEKLEDQTGVKKQEASAAPASAPEDVEMADTPAVEEQPQSAQEVKDTEVLPDAPTADVETSIAAEDAPKNSATEPSPSSAPEPAPEATPDESTTKDGALVSADAVKPSGEGPTSATDDLQPASLSQLAIETKDSDESPVQESVEVSIPDASTIKVAREREDDVEGEPAPKRARTEPKEDEAEGESQIAVPEESAAPETSPPSFADFPRWNDSDDNVRPITPYQRRRIRAVIARVKKTKHGAHFRDSVQKLWPQLWDKYLARIEKSMDLSEIERNLRDPENTYNTFGEFKKDLGLILENTHTFNGADHYITQAARGATKAIWVDVYEIPEDEPAPAKPLPKTNRVRESRSANPKADPPASTENSTQQTSTTTQPPADTSAAPTSAKSAQTAESRRASTATEGDRPKRTVRAPKPKDIDYTTKPPRKKPNKPELQFAEETLTELMAPKHYRLNQWFLDPVDPVALGIPNYYSVIKNPMDLGKVSSMLANGDISSLKDFEKNMKLIFANCYLFNGEPNPDSVSYFAKQLEDMYVSLMRGKDNWLAKHSKANPPPPPSNGSDDEEEEEEEEGEEGGGEAHMAKEVKELEARLHEEMGKQTSLLMDDQPNESMILIQQGIVKVVQEALLKAKMKLNEHRQKSGGAAAKPAKKATKTGKTKTTGGGGGGRKAAGAAAQPKKGGGGAKKAKKNLTAADKDQIANAINDLEGPHLDRAIDIIKRDTGSKESEDGELELDIDQLSNEALLKLWELCKKVLDGFGKDSSAPVASPEQTRGSSKSAAKTAAKPKKNKPMSAQEQEARIAQLREMRNLYKGGQDVGDPALSPQGGSGGAEDSSEDSSEEE